MVDRFGGTACEIAVIDENIRYTSDLLGTKFFSRLCDAFELVGMDVDHTRHAREAVALEEMANID